MAPVCWGLWESRTGPAGSRVCLSGLNPPHSEWERQEELNFSQLLLWRWEPAAALSASHKVFSLRSSTVWHFFLPLCTFSLDSKTCCFSQNTAKATNCDMLSPFKRWTITGNAHRYSITTPANPNELNESVNKSSILKWYELFLMLWPKFDSVLAATGTYC